MFSKLRDQLLNEFRQIYPELWPFEHLGILNCQQDISKAIWARGLKLGQLIGDDE